MRDKVAARRYARAIIECAKEPDELEKIGRELASFASLYLKTPDLSSALLHPAIPDERKKNILQEVSMKMGLSVLCVDALAVILARGRISLVTDIAESFAEMADEKLRRVKVYVTSAYPLKENDIKKLEERFSTLTGKEARVETRLDKSLIGGIVARAGSMVYDGSISNQLRLMKIKLEQEA